VLQREKVEECRPTKILGIVKTLTRDSVDTRCDQGLKKRGDRGFQTAYHKGPKSIKGIMAGVRKGCDLHKSDTQADTKQLGASAWKLSRKRGPCT